MAWDASKPVASSNVESPPIRSNFQAIEQSLYGRNLFADSQFLMWHKENDLAHWRKSATGTFTRETSTIKFGNNAVKLVYGGAGTDSLDQFLLDDATQLAFLAGIPLSMGCWIKSNTASCFLRMSSTAADEVTTASTGTDTWEWLTLSGFNVASSSLTDLKAGVKVTGAGTVYISHPTLVLGEIPPQWPIPSAAQVGTIALPMAGDPVATGVQIRFSGKTPLMLDSVLLQAISTNDSTTPWIADVQKYTGTGWVSMFLSADRPTITTGKVFGGNEPSLSATSTGIYAGAYSLATILPLFGTSTDTSTGKLDNAEFRLVVADAGTSTGVKNPLINSRWLWFPRPLIVNNTWKEYR